MDSPKYNRTYHFSWSEGAQNDDRISEDVSGLLDTPILITEKIDGSNTSLEAEGCFARTHSGPPAHLSFDGLKALHGSVKQLIPKGIQIFGEWVYAKHSIEYSELPGYFMMFNVRDLNYGDGMWASWEEIQEWAHLLDVPTVPVLFQGVIHSEKELQKLVHSFMTQPSTCGGIKEGTVVRTADAFQDKDFSKYMRKFVRKNHVQTSEHWKNQEIVKNKLKI